MNPRELLAAFQKRLHDTGVDIASATVEAGVSAMLAFYVNERADGCHVDDDSDMLLFQWGTYDWGGGRRFEVDITRQIVLPDEEDDDAIWQLHLTYRFAPTHDLEGHGAGDRWCHAPAELPAFREFIASTGAFRALAQRPPVDVELNWERAG